MPCLLLVGCGDRAPQGQISALSYGYGSYHGGYYSYQLELVDGQLLFGASGSNGVEMEVYDALLPPETLDILAQIITEQQIWHWDGFRKSDNSVLDGYSFILEVLYDSGQSINASAYMRYPNNYEAGHQALADFFGALATEYQYQPLDWGEIREFRFACVEGELHYNLRATWLGETGQATIESRDAEGNLLATQTYLPKQNFFESLQSFSTRYHLDSWDGYQAAPEDADHAQAFELYIRDNQGQRISAAGSGSYLSNFLQIRSPLLQLFLWLEDNAAVAP